MILSQYLWDLLFATFLDLTTNVFFIPLMLFQAQKCCKPTFAIQAFAKNTIVCVQITILGLRGNFIEKMIE